MTGRPGASSDRRRARALLGGVLGAAVGFGVGTGIYLLVGPVLEESDGIVRELQGLLWNLVPLLTVAGAIAGGWLALRSR